MHNLNIVTIDLPSYLGLGWVRPSLLSVLQAKKWKNLKKVYEKTDRFIVTCVLFFSQPTNSCVFVKLPSRDITKWLKTYLLVALAKIQYARHDKPTISCMN
jgi:hypothetical protein